MMREEVFIGGWTLAQLRAKSQNERHALWRRAKALHSAEGNHLARAIERLGLPYAEPEPLADDDGLKVRMKAIFASPAARAAAVEATLDGLPALAGLDALLHDELGEAYRQDAAAAPTAQLMTAELMMGLGYVEAGRKDLPARCVARSGVFWRKAVTQSH
ncbi:MAG TPA: hypothetical protein VG248_09920 [Caulobacteraceae bacterium]|jgi:hypothetical protein|nr:hypothetical protein [Caulobacteraceae bacterium]